MATSSGLILATVYNQSQLAKRKHLARYWSINTAAMAVPLSLHTSAITKLAAAIFGGLLFGGGVLPAQYCPCGFKRRYIKFSIRTAKLMRQCRTTFSEPLPPVIAFMEPELHAFKLLFFCRIGGRGHFWSRDKDGGHTIRSAIADNPLLYANFTTVSFIEPELLVIEVLHCVNRQCRVFWRKIVKLFLFASKKEVDVAETRFLSHKTRKSVKRGDLYRSTSTSNK